MEGESRTLILLVFTVAEKGHSQNIFPKSTGVFSNGQLFFKSGDIFHIHNYFLNKSIVFKPIHRKSFKSRNPFQIHKKIKKRQIFFKSTKWLEIIDSFSNPQKKFKSVSLFQMLKIIRNRQISLKSTNKLKIGESLFSIFLRLRLRLCKHNTSK